MYINVNPILPAAEGETFEITQFLLRFSILKISKIHDNYNNCRLLSQSISFARKFGFVSSSKLLRHPYYITRSLVCQSTLADCFSPNTFWVNREIKFVLKYLFHLHERNHLNSNFYANINQLNDECKFIKFLAFICHVSPHIQ